MTLFYGVHVYNLKLEVSRAEFERFVVEEWLPFVMRKPGCKGANLLKGYTGEWMKQKLDYATMDIWESCDANRNAWGGPTNVWIDPPDLHPLMERFRSYVQPASFRTLEFECII